MEKMEVEEISQKLEDDANSQFDYFSEEDEEVECSEQKMQNFAEELQHCANLFYNASCDKISFDQMKNDIINNGIAIKNAKLKNLIYNFVDIESTQTKKSNNISPQELAQILDKKITKQYNKNLKTEISDETITTLHKQNIKELQRKAIEFHKLYSSKRATSFQLNCHFGIILELYVTKIKEKNSSSHKIKSIYKKFRISDSYARKLRYISNLVCFFPRLQYLNTSVTEFYKYKKIIDILFDKNNYELYKNVHDKWKNIKNN